MTTTPVQCDGCHRWVVVGPVLRDGDGGRYGPKCGTARGLRPGRRVRVGKPKATAVEQPPLDGLEIRGPVTRPRTAAAAVVLLLLLTGCGTQPANPPEPAAVVVEKDHDPDRTVPAPWGGDMQWWGLHLCLTDSAEEPTDVCTWLGVDRDTWRGYELGDRFLPVPDSLLAAAEGGR